VTNEPDDFRQTGGLAGERRRKTRKAFGKDAPIAPLVSAPPARQTGVDDNRRSLSGQIPKRSRVWIACRILDSGQAAGCPL
jgi:hypothetical protein